MTDNKVIDIFTKTPVDRTKNRSSTVREILNRFDSFSQDNAQRSIVVVTIGDNGEYETDFHVQPEDFDKMCIVLGSLSDEMSDYSMGFVDLDDDED